jgi:4-hydroxybenzoate polyprenyltransferase
VSDASAASTTASAPPRPNKIRVLLELVKFEHSIFALPYAYIGAIYGALSVPVLVPLTGAAAPASAGLWTTPEAWPTWTALLWITVAMVAARALAFVVNRAVDKEIDARNPRTADRAIPAGHIAAWELWLFAAFMLGAYLHAVWQLAPVTHWLWPIPLAMFLVYPYLKRYTPLAHFWLGACLGLGAVGGWAGVGGSLANPAPWLFGAAVAIWTAGFDIIYATQDVECDVRDGLHSVPADLGVARGLLITKVTHAAAIVLFALAGYFVGAGIWYYVGVVVAGILLAYENAIISPEDMSRVNAAFFTVNGFVAVVILAGALADRLIH